MKVVSYYSRVNERIDTFPSTLLPRSYLAQLAFPTPGSRLVEDHRSTPTSCVVSFIDSAVPLGRRGNICLAQVRLLIQYI
jgi:hypothetical protein